MAFICRLLYFPAASFVGDAEEINPKPPTSTRPRLLPLGLSWCNEDESITYATNSLSSFSNTGIFIGSLGIIPSLVPIFLNVCKINSR